MTARRVKSAGFDGIEIHSANGGLGDPARAAELIASGQADVVALGKAALANYDWVNKVEAGKGFPAAYRMDSGNDKEQD
ncbi:hypothetical protein [Oligella ureolytica]|nr:hypothetical protein [Oligella ureolytica]